MAGEFSMTQGQGLAQIGLIVVAVLLSAIIGLERELRQKASGLRTHTLVGLGAALFMLVSKYGFGDLVGDHGISLDPSRVAAQIVSGIGFIGGGVIFVRRDMVRGLTSAAVIWVTAAIGMACGAGLPILAAAVTFAHLIVVYGLTGAGRWLPRSRRSRRRLRIGYLDGTGAFRAALVEATNRDFTVIEVQIERTPHPDFADLGRDDRRDREQAEGRRRGVEVMMLLQGKEPVTDLAAAIAELPGVLSVTAGDPDYVEE